MLKELIEIGIHKFDARVIGQNGSRVNPNAPIDPFMDYDVVFVVDDFTLESLEQGLKSVEALGNVVIRQQNHFDDGSVITMYQFESFRVDLKLIRLSQLDTYIKEDSLTHILYDGGDYVPLKPEADESSHFILKPDSQEVIDKVNNVFWVSLYVAKGILRNEPLYAMTLYNEVFLDDIKMLLRWVAGAQGDWKVNVGSCGKWLRRFCPESMVEAYERLYTGYDPQILWEKLYEASELVFELMFTLEKELNIKCNHEEAMRTMSFLKYWEETYLNTSEVHMTDS